MKSVKMAKALSPLLVLAMVLSLMSAVLFTTAAPVSATISLLGGPGDPTYHVNGAIGDDSYNNTQAQNPATPWKTIQHAVNNATAGSAIIVHDGEYAGFTVDKSLTIRSDNGTANTTINSTVTIELGWDDGDNPMAEVGVLGGSGVGFTINSAVVDGGDAVETIVKHGSSLTIEGNIIRNHLAGIGVEEVGADSYLAILDNEIYGNDGAGININEIYTSEVLIEGNDIYENAAAIPDTGIWIDTVSQFSYLSIIDNEIFNNTGDGIYIYDIYYFSQVTITGNNITNNTMNGTCVVYVTYNGYLTISDNTVTGNNADGIYIYEIYNGGRAVIGGQPNIISENGDDGIEIEHVYDGSYLAILDNEIINNTDDGIHFDSDIWDGSDVIFHNNAISGNGGEGIEINDVATNSRINITANQITDNGGDGIYTEDIDDSSTVVIGGEPNIITDNGGYGIYIDYVDYGSYLAILGNDIINNADDGIYLSSGVDDGSTVIIGGEPNIITDNGGYGIYADDVDYGSYLAILGNEITNNTGDGIDIEDIDDGSTVVIGGESNIITDNDGYGIYVNSVDYGSYLAILGNDIINNTISGIYIYDGIDDGSTVIIGGEPNTITDNGGYGIYVDYVDYGSYLAILGNDIINNTDDGIYIYDDIDDGSEVIIGGEPNIISDNGGYGIYVEGTDWGSYLAILDNEIINNADGGIYSGYIENGGEVVIGGEGNIIQDNGGYGILVDYVDWGSYLAILGNDIINNTKDGIRIISGIIRGSEVIIGGEGNIISDNGGYGIYTAVYAGSRLAILDNEVNNNGLDGIYIYEIVEGSYVLIQDNNAISGNNGTGIYIDYMCEGGKLALINNLIEDNNATGIGRGGVYVDEIDDGCEVWVLSNTIIDNDGVGLWLDVITDSKVTIKGNSISDNTADGIRLWSMFHTPVIIWSNDILGNDQWGISVDGTAAGVYANENNIVGNANGTSNENPTDASLEVDATYNWWGAASGPSGAGNGTGDSVSANVTFDPWLTSSVTIIPTVRALYNFEVPGIVNATADTDTLMTFSDTGYVSGFVCIDKIAPPAQAANFTADTGATAVKFIAVLIFDFDTGTAHIELHYTGGEIPAGIDPSTLLLYYWNGTHWVECDNSGVDTVNRTVYGDIPVLALYEADPPVAAGGVGLPILVVNITMPSEGSTFSTCQNFTVTATVTNEGEATATGVTATISIDANANTTENETKDLGDIPGGGNATVSWTVHCDGSGNSTINVTAAGKDAITHENIPPEDIEPDSITIHQQNKTHLVVDITSPLNGTSLNTCQNFTVNVTITNNGEANATGVNVTIILGSGVNLQPAENGTHVIGDIPGGENRTTVWYVHCNTTGTSVIWVNVTAGTDNNTGEPVYNIENDTITVDQQTEAHLVVDITSPPSGSTYSTCQNFTVTATVTNTGGATATGVHATVDPGATASVVSGANPQSLGNISGGGYATATWTLHCDSSGDSVITVTASGTDANTGLAIPTADIDPDSVTVHQETKVHLVVNITYPADGTNFNTYQDFMVNATVTNTGAATATGVTATIDPGATASLAVGEAATKATTPATIPSGSSGTVSWNLRCDSVGDSVITVTAAGTDANTGAAILADNIAPDSITVHQQTKAHLVVVINCPADDIHFKACQDFTVNVTISNTGGATATGVTATIDPGATASLAVGEPVTKATTPATIPGGGSGTVSWTLHCDSVGDSVITVTAAGTDANTGLAIPTADIDPDSVTVHQEKEAAGLPGGTVAGIAILAAIAAAILGSLIGRRKEEEEEEGKAEG